MQITLNIKGEEKTFESGFVPALYYREFLAIRKDMDFTNMSQEDYDTLIGLVSRAFSSQFTVDEFWNGIGVGEFDSTILEFIQFVNGKPSKSGNEKKTK